MSEYIEVETDISDDLTVLYVTTNVALTPEGEAEIYESVSAMEEGSPVAQSLSFIEGVRYLRLEGSEMTIRRDSDVPWHLIIAELSAAIKDFFL